MYWYIDYRRMGWDKKLREGMRATIKYGEAHLFEGRYERNSYVTGINVDFLLRIK